MDEETAERLAAIEAGLAALTVALAALKRSPDQENAISLEQYAGPCGTSRQTPSSPRSCHTP
jgi:hypothetical protein